MANSGSERMKRAPAAVVLGMFIASVAFLALATQVSPAYAAVTQWQTYPGIQYPYTEPDLADRDDLTEYGWHFDEGSTYFSARDFNHSSDGGGTMKAFMSFEIMVNLDWWLTYWVEEYDDSCHAKAWPQRWDEAEGWVGMGYMDLHFIHIKNTIEGFLSNDGYGISDGDWIERQIATLTANFTVCVQGGYAHLHQSADMDPGSLVWRHNFSDAIDTCWVDTDNQHCNGDFGSNNYERDHRHTVSATCPASAPFYNSGNYSNTGTVGLAGSGLRKEYDCAEWQAHSHESEQAVFYMHD